MLMRQLFLLLLSITFLGTGGFLVIRYKLFKMAVCYEITTVTLNLFLIFSACLVNDINIFDYTVLLLALIAAETAMALSLIIINLGPLVLKAYIATSFSFIDNGVDRTRPASNGLNPAQVPF